MVIPDELITMAVGGSAALLLGNTWKIIQIATTLKQHIRTEDINDKKVRRQLHQIRIKLPNGEVEKTFQMVRELHGYFEDEIREWKLGEEGKMVDAENARMDARQDQGV